MEIIKYFENNQVRIDIDEKGEIWWCVKDACNILDISNHKNVISALPERRKRPVHTMDPSGHNR